MGRITTTEAAGGAIRRVREDRGITRAELAARTGLSVRSIYSLETGESQNFGLGNYLKLLEALDLVMSVDLDPMNWNNAPIAPAPAVAPAPPTMPWNDLAPIWRLDNDGGDPT